MSTDSPVSYETVGTPDPLRPSVIGRTLRYLRSHPKLCLFLLTPGIVEYLSGSSPFYYLVADPFVFAYQIVVNAGLYLPGALLIREASIRWKKGWGSVLLMGAAYGILEEGLAFGTLFNAKAALGGLQSYGHWLGVSWVWASLVIPLHMIFSITLPIFLLGLALPETQGKSLLGSRRSLAAAASVLCLDVLFGLFAEVHIEHVWMGLPLFALSVSAIGVLVISARLAPKGLIHARSETPKVSSLLAGVLGALVYTSIALEAYGGNDVDFPAAAVVFLMVASLLLSLFCVLRLLGKKSNERQLIAFAFGLIVPVMVGGAVSQIFLPLVLAADVIALLFFRKLWVKYGGGSIHKGGAPIQEATTSPNVEIPISAQPIVEAGE